MTDMELRLRELADHLDVPAGDGLAAAVTARLGVDRRPRRWWRWLVGLVVAVGIGIPTVPAVAHRFGIGGLAVHEEAAPESAASLDLGRQVSLAHATRAAGFRPLLPAGLGRPDEVWLDDRGPAPVVWLRWRGGPLLTELRGGLPAEPVMHKFVANGQVQVVDVGGRPGLWVEGAHQVAIEAGESIVVQRLRTSDSTLLVEVGQVTVRLESAGSRDDAIRLARSLGT
ncbi:MAG: hypothetical protein JWN29_244 [Acidimicrobiales bacterium]|nr:hypothetical protein [Acidimicrobiales bacterium]